MLSVYQKRANAKVCRQKCGNLTLNGGGVCTQCLDKKRLIDGIRQQRKSLGLHVKAKSPPDVRIPKTARQRPLTDQVCGGGVRHIRKKVAE